MIGDKAGSVGSLFLLNVAPCSIVEPAFLNFIEEKAFYSYKIRLFKAVVRMRVSKVT